MRALTQPPLAPDPPPRVLIVDDAADNREMYAAYLERAGFRVGEAATAVQALAQIEREPADLVVTDIALPGVDGIELCRRLKHQGGENQHTHVIALTGLSLGESDVERALEAGSDAVLFKPCLPDRLLLEIRKVLARSRELRAEARTARERAVALSRKATALQERSGALHHHYRSVVRAMSEERLVKQIRVVYDERPLLALTVEQAAFLWSVDVVEIGRALNSLADAGVLIHTAADLYVRRVRVPSQ